MKCVVNLSLYEINLSLSLFLSSQKTSPSHDGVVLNRMQWIALLSNFNLLINSWSWIYSLTFCTNKELFLGCGRHFSRSKKCVLWCSVHFLVSVLNIYFSSVLTCIYNIDKDHPIYSRTTFTELIIPFKCFTFSI